MQAMVTFGMWLRAPIAKSRVCTIPVPLDDNATSEVPERQKKAGVCCVVIEVDRLWGSSKHAAQF